MTAEEYKFILEKHIDHAMLAREKLAYALALDLFLMVEKDEQKEINAGPPAIIQESEKEPDAKEQKAEPEQSVEESNTAPKAPKRKYNYKTKTCRICGAEFKPSFGQQSVCVNCAGKIADNKMKKHAGVKKEDRSEAKEIVERLEKRR